MTMMAFICAWWGESKRGRGRVSATRRVGVWVDGGSNGGVAAPAQWHPLLQLAFDSSQDSFRPGTAPGHCPDGLACSSPSGSDHPLVGLGSTAKPLVSLKKAARPGQTPCPLNPNPVWPRPRPRSPAAAALTPSWLKMMRFLKHGDVVATALNSTPWPLPSVVSTTRAET